MPPATAAKSGKSAKLAASLAASKGLSKAAAHVANTPALHKAAARKNEAAILDALAKAGVGLTEKEQAYVVGFLTATQGLDDKGFAAAIQVATGPTSG